MKISEIQGLCNEAWRQGVGVIITTKAGIMSIAPRFSVVGDSKYGSPESIIGQSGGGKTENVYFTEILNLELAKLLCEKTDLEKNCATCSTGCSCYPGMEGAGASPWENPASPSEISEGLAVPPCY